MPTLRDDGQLVEVGRVVAAFQRAVADFPVDSGMVWRNPEGWPRHGEVVIHTDIAPWNILEADGTISGLVEFDSARPGRAIEDVAYAAWHMTPLHDEPMGDGAVPPAVADRPGGYGSLPTPGASILSLVDAWSRRSPGSR